MTTLPLAYINRVKMLDLVYLSFHWSCQVFYLFISIALITKQLLKTRCCASHSLDLCYFCKWPFQQLTCFLSDGWLTSNRNSTLFRLSVDLPRRQTVVNVLFVWVLFCLSFWVALFGRVLRHFVQCNRVLVCTKTFFETASFCFQLTPWFFACFRLLFACEFCH